MLATCSFFFIIFSPSPCSPSPSFSVDLFSLIVFEEAKGRYLMRRSCWKRKDASIYCLMGWRSGARRGWRADAQKNVVGELGRSASVSPEKFGEFCWGFLLIRPPFWYCEYTFWQVLAYTFLLSTKKKNKKKKQEVVFKNELYRRDRAHKEGLKRIRMSILLRPSYRLLQESSMNIIWLKNTKKLSVLIHDCGST